MVERQAGKIDTEEVALADSSLSILSRLLGPCKNLYGLQRHHVPRTIRVNDIWETVLLIGRTHSRCPCCLLGTANYGAVSKVHGQLGGCRTASTAIASTTGCVAELCAVGGAATAKHRLFCLRQCEISSLT